MVGKLLQNLYNFRSKIYNMPSKIYYSNSKLVMTEVELYQNTNNMPRKDSSEALEEYFSRIQWKAQNARILDVGCGDGGVTAEVLKPRLPKTLEKLIGCDISKEMVAHANLHHKYKRTKFVVFDIVANVTGMMGHFDHVFSFYTLNWVQDQREPSQTSTRCLFPGVIAFYFLFAINQYMMPIVPWRVRPLGLKRGLKSQYMFDFENSISPYHDSQNPVEEYTNLMHKCSFKNVEVQCKRKDFIFRDFDTMKKLLRSVNPTIHRLPPALRERFMEDLMHEVMQKDGISKMINKNDESEEIKFFYTLLLAYASK